MPAHGSDTALEQRYAYMPAHGSDTSPTLPAMEEIWMIAAFSTPIALLDSKLAALFRRGRRALVRRRGATQFTLKCFTISSSVTESRTLSSLSLKPALLIRRLRPELPTNFSSWDTKSGNASESVTSN